MSRLPYLRRLGARDRVAIWLVDGHWIRNCRDVEFTNGAHHFSRPYVPRDEVWVDRERPGAGELTFVVEHQLLERELMSRGLTYLAALRRASDAERRWRRSARGLERPPPFEEARRAIRRRPLRPPSRIGAVAERVWLVDGRGVRDLFHPDFTEGGHGLRYRFIPRAEIWIDDAIRAAEREPVLVHEVTELGLMRAGLTYDEAHHRASRIEAGIRSGGRLRLALPRS